jgi:hypothetical protein
MLLTLLRWFQKYIFLVLNNSKTEASWREAREGLKAIFSRIMWFHVNLSYIRGCLIVWSLSYCCTYIIYLQFTIFKWNNWIVCLQDCSRHFLHRHEFSRQHVYVFSWSLISRVWFANYADMLWPFWRNYFLTVGY